MNRSKASVMPTPEILFTCHFSPFTSPLCVFVVNFLLAQKLARIGDVPGQR
jgi:hypothetical protein